MDKFIVSPSPVVTSKHTTRKIMLDVCIALIPATVVAAIYFGAIVIALVAVCVVTAVAAELCFNMAIALSKGQKLNKKFFLHGSHTDVSAVVTGLLLALNLPAKFPLYYAAVGSVFAIVFVKMIFGGIGRNFANPALAARVLLFVSFGTLIASSSPNAFAIDGTATATWLGARNPDNIKLLDMLLGITPSAAVGEVCAPALLAGAAYLCIRKVIDFKLPLYMIGSTFVFALLIDGLQNFDKGALTALVEIPTAHILSGGVILGACFMANDYATSPDTPLGTLIYGIAIGLLVVVIRVFSSMPEGVSFAILIMNIVAPHIDKIILTKRFSAAKKEVGA